MDKENVLAFLVDFHLIEITTILLLFVANRLIQFFYFGTFRFSKAFIFLLLIPAGVHFFFSTVNEKARSSKMELMSQLLPNSRLILLEFGLSGMTGATPNDDANYLRLVEAEKEILKENPQISDVYTLTKNNENKLIFLVDSETDYNRDGDYDDDRESRTQIGEVYDNLKELSDQAWNGHTGLRAQSESLTS